MQPDPQSFTVYNYPDIYSEYIFRNASETVRPCPPYTLIFVFAGELIVSNKEQETTIRKGEYIFLRKDMHTFLKRNSFEGESFSSIFMGFNPDFLREFYRGMKEKDRCGKTGDFAGSIIELPCNPYLESMYISLIPYVHRHFEPMRQIVEIKLMEAVFSLLLTDDKFYSCLFDVKNMRDNNLFTLTVDTHTESEDKGRSTPFFDYDLLSSYFRDKQHCKISSLLCKIVKKSEANYIRILHNNKGATLYMEAGYSNVTRFTRILAGNYVFRQPNKYN